MRSRGWEGRRCDAAWGSLRDSAAPITLHSRTRDQRRRHGPEPLPQRIDISSGVDHVATAESLRPLVAQQGELLGVLGFRACDVLHFESEEVVAQLHHGVHLTFARTRPQMRSMATQGVHLWPELLHDNR